MQVLAEDKEITASSEQTLAEVLSQALSGKKFKKTIACKCDGHIYDLSEPLGEGCHTVEPVTLDSQEGKSILRHSAAHIMAEAVKRLFPGAKVTIGPDIANGFYYDFDFERSFTPEDLEAIEKEMSKIVSEDQGFEREVLSKKEAKKIFLHKNEPYKIELLEDMEDQEVSIYRNDDFADLCRGPHVPSTSYVQAFKLTTVAGAYWRGDETRPMLQRIYGTAWPTPKELKAYLNQLEEAKKRDHRKLGNQLDLFSFSEEAAPGIPIWHPKGALIRTILEDFERKEHLRRGYHIVQGPQILRRELWQKSGHYDNYRENMYFTEIDEQVYGIKPMNCLAHMHVYKSRLRSYRDLPIRYFELGTVLRHEKSGVLHGLMRVRQFTQDDAHILCRPDQLQEEITAILNFVRDIMHLFGFDYEVEISTRPEKSIGSEEDWDRATTALTRALDDLGLDYGICAGEGAFYGPKIDIKLNDALNRQWQCATIQCDFTLPERFDLVYVGQDGERHRPVMLHRVILGAVERFLGVLIEHYAGALPTWLAPVQARVLPISEHQAEYAQNCSAELRAAGLRTESDLRNEKLGYKIREAQLQKIPYVLVAGEKEIEALSLNVRLLGGKNIGMKTVPEVIELIRHDAQEPFKRGGMSYSFTYC